MVTPDPDTLAFTEALFGYVPEGRSTLLWTLQDKRSTWFELGSDAAPTEVALGAQSLAADGMDVYVAVSVTGTRGKANERIASANSTGIVGLWADIDIADPDVHKKWNLPPDEKSARELLADAGLPPSLLVHSGHGLQAWWLFAEFWAFDTEQDRQRAATLAQRWNSTLRIRAAKKGWTVDSTFDLARVMRVPGTMNRKGLPVVPVQLLERNDEARYTEDDFEAKFVDESELRAAGITPTKSYVSDEIEIHDASAPNFERFQALMANDERFNATFNMKRKDLPDQSPSSYDMSIANQLARYVGWSDQDVADCIFFFRRHNKLDTAKARRVDYIKRTIEAARNAVAREGADDEMYEAAEALRVAEASEDPEAIRAAKRTYHEGIGTKVGLEIVNWIKYMSEPAFYALETPIGRVDLGEVDNVMRPDRFRAKVYDALGVLIPRMKGPEWDEVVAHLSTVADQQYVGAEATSHGEMLAWLTQYLAARPPAGDLKEASISEYPFVDEEGRVALFVHGFRRWLHLTYQERLTNQVIGKRLRAFGCENVVVNVEIEPGKRTSRSVWRLPADGLK